jgi:DNA repair protein RecO (recombination protein O)
MVEAAERLTMEESSPQQYLLLVGALRSLATKEHDSSLILDSYLLRALAIAGWAPSFDDCARCEAKGPHSAFVMQVGSVVCQECKPIGAVSMSLETTALLGALLSGDWELAENSAPSARANASGIVAAYSQWHIERGLKSMPHVERA